MLSLMKHSIWPAAIAFTIPVLGGALTTIHSDLAIIVRENSWYLMLWFVVIVFNGYLVGLAYEFRCKIEDLSHLTPSEKQIDKEKYFTKSKSTGILSLVVGTVVLLLRIFNVL